MLVFSNFIINFAMLWKLYVHVILTIGKIYDFHYKIYLK